MNTFGPDQFTLKCNTTTRKTLEPQSPSYLPLGSNKTSVKKMHQVKVPDDTVLDRKRSTKRTVLLLGLLFVFFVIGYRHYPEVESEETSIEEWIEFYWGYAEHHVDDPERIKKHFKGLGYPKR